MGIRGQRFDTLEDIKCSTTTGLNIIPKEAFHVCFQAWQKPWSNVCVCVCLSVRPSVRPSVKGNHIGKHCTSSTEVVWLNSRKIFTPTYSDFSLYSVVETGTYILFSHHLLLNQPSYVHRN